MRRRAAWLCLFLALVGPTLGRARAAYGLGLALAEVGQNAIESEQEDRDENDPGLDVLAPMAAAPVNFDALADVPALDALAPRGAGELVPSAFLDARRRHGWWGWPPPPTLVRHARLQVFRF